MSICFNVDGKSSSNDIVDCRCSISKDYILNGEHIKEIETKIVNSIWGVKDSKVVKLWERKTENLPQFLILGESTMYVSDDLTSFVTLNSYSNSDSSGTLPANEGKVCKDYPVGNINGTYLSTCYGNFYVDETETGYRSGYNICSLVKKDDCWKWIRWGKVKSFTSPVLKGVFSIDNKQIIFITALNEYNVNCCYYSLDNGATWEYLTNYTVKKIYCMNNTFIFITTSNVNVNGEFVSMDDVQYATFSENSIGNLNNIFDGCNYSITTKFSITSIILLNDLWVIYLSNNLVYQSSDNGNTWSTPSTSSLLCSKFSTQSYSSISYSDGTCVLANMSYNTSSSSSTNLYHPYYSYNGYDWSYLSSSGNMFSNTGQYDSSYFSAILNKFIYIINDIKSILIIDSMENGVSYSSYQIPEENVLIIENQYYLN